MQYVSTHRRIKPLIHGVNSASPPPVKMGVVSSNYSFCVSGQTDWEFASESVRLVNINFSDNGKQK
jgi:hypothetical protein